MALRPGTTENFGLGLARGFSDIGDIVQRDKAGDLYEQGRTQLEQLRQKLLGDVDQQLSKGRRNLDKKTNPMSVFYEDVDLIQKTISDLQNIPEGFGDKYSENLQSVYGQMTKVPDFKTYKMDNEILRVNEESGEVKSLYKQEEQTNPKNWKLYEQDGEVFVGEQLPDGTIEKRREATTNELKDYEYKRTSQEQMTLGRELTLDNKQNPKRKSGTNRKVGKIKPLSTQLNEKTQKDAIEKVKKTTRQEINDMNPANLKTFSSYKEYLDDWQLAAIEEAKGNPEEMKQFLVDYNEKVKEVATQESQQVDVQDLAQDRISFAETLQVQREEVVDIANSYIDDWNTGNYSIESIIEAAEKYVNSLRKSGYLPEVIKEAESVLQDLKNIAGR